MSCTLFSQEKSVVTVFEFLEDSGASTALSKAVTRSFETQLHQTGRYQLIEKNQFNNVLSQQGFEISGITEDSEAIEIGKILNSEYIIVGSITKLSSLFIVSARLISITTGQIEKAEQIMGETEKALIENIYFLAVKIAGGSKPPSSPQETSNQKEQIKGLLYIKSDSTVMDFKIFDNSNNLITSGETPQAIELTLGKYQLKATDKDNLYLDFSENITIDSDNKKTVSINPVKNFYMLSIEGSTVDGNKISGDLFIDGRGVGKLPFNGPVNLKAHDIKFIPSNDWYQIWENHLSPSGDHKDKKIAFELEPIIVKMTILTNPTVECSLYLNGKFMGLTPDRFMIPCGFNTIRLTGSRENGSAIDITQNIEVSMEQDGTTMTLDIIKISSTPSSIALTSPSSNAPAFKPEIKTKLNGDGQMDITISNKILTGLDESNTFYCVGVNIGYLFDIEGHKLHAGLLWDYTTFKPKSSLFESNEEEEEVLRFSFAGDFFYRYKISSGVTFGLHWAPGVSVEQDAVFDFIFDTERIFHAAFQNDLAASVGIDFAQDWLGVYWKVGVRTRTTKSETEAELINAIGVTLNLDLF